MPNSTNKNKKSWSIPENVNFGIIASTVRRFLKSAGFTANWPNKTGRESIKEPANILKNQAVIAVFSTGLEAYILTCEGSHKRHKGC